MKECSITPDTSAAAAGEDRWPVIKQEGDTEAGMAIGCSCQLARVRTHYST